MSEEQDKSVEAVESEATEAAAPAEVSNSVSLSEGRGGIVGVKAGMTQVYAEDGSQLAVTVIDLRENVVTQVKSREKDGYEAIQVGVLEKDAKKVNKTKNVKQNFLTPPNFTHAFSSPKKNIKFKKRNKIL